MTVSYELVNGVVWLTINRPEARNALDRAAREGLLAGLRRFCPDDTARVLVLTGAGDQAFCAGGDLEEMADEASTVPPPDFVPQPVHRSEDAQEGPRAFREERAPGWKGR